MRIISFLSSILIFVIFYNPGIYSQHLDENQLPTTPIGEPTIQEKVLIDTVNIEMDKLKEYLNWRPSSFFMSTVPFWDRHEQLRTAFSRLIHMGGEFAIYHVFENMREIVSLAGKAYLYAREYKPSDDAMGYATAGGVSAHGGTALLVIFEIVNVFNSSFEQAVSSDKTKTYGENNTPYIVPWLNITETEVKKTAARVLGILQAKGSVPSLIEALQDNYYSVRKEAAWTLGIIGDNRALEPLTLILKDDSTQVRFAAAVALYKISGNDAQPTIKTVKEQMLKALQGKNANMRIYSIQCLAELQAIEALDDLEHLVIEDPEEKVRNFAAEKVKELKRKKHQ